MSNNKDSVLHQVRLIQAQVFAAIEEANAGVPTERRVTPGSALTAVKRSLSATRHLPFEVREFQAMRELSAFINLAQKNAFSDTFANHTDLLPVAHPASTRVHGLTASALVEAHMRWILSDTRISEQARPLLASVFTSSSDSVEYKYAMTRLSNLPAGSYPLEALVAAFGDGNSAFARRARAMLQRRDRKGRFAFQGGGMSALVERINGMVQRLTGRVVSQSEDGNTVRIQLPNGRLVDVPVDGGEFIKAVLDGNKDGFSGVAAKHKVGDVIINEEDLQFFDAPHGFEKDASYKGPGVRYTDGAYNVDKNGKNFVITRIEDGNPVGTTDNWADAQKMMYNDEPAADVQAGRTPVARLTQDQIDRMYDPNFDPREILTPAGADLGKGTESDVSSALGEFQYNYPEGAYQLPQDVKHVSGFNDPVNGSTDYTDDPAELAQKFETDALVNALREALIPSQASKANGEGNLKFNKKEPVAAEAIYLALEEKGVNAKQEVAKIYDAANGDKKNQEALARLEAKPAEVTKPESVAKTPETPSEPSAPSAPSVLEEQPTEPPAAPMRKGQVSPGGDWKWYPPVRMGGNQQLQGHWGMTEKGIAKLPPKEAKTPFVAPEPVLPDEIGGGWEPAIDTQGGKNAPMYKKTIDGSNFVFIQKEGGWIPLRVVNGERRLLTKYDNENILQNANADDFENKVAFIQDNMQKAYRQGLETDLKSNNFDKKVIDLVQDGKADEIIAAIKADPVYKELEDKYQDYLNDAGGLPGVMKAVVALGKINENLDQIRDFNNSVTPTNEPDIADLVDEVKGGIPTSSEIQAMLDGEGIGSEDNISGDAPSEVLPKALQEPKAVPADFEAYAEQLNKMQDLADQLLNGLGEGTDRSRGLSAGVSIGLAEDAFANAMAKADDPVEFDNEIQMVGWHLTSAIATLNDIKTPEAQGLRNQLIEIRNNLEEARGKFVSENKGEKVSLDKVVESMLLGGEPDVAVEDLVPNVEVPLEAPVEPPVAGKIRRVLNNNVAANRRWQARFGIKPPVFYKKNRGMFYDINGVPVNVGDKVVHNADNFYERHPEIPAGAVGVIVSRIPNLGRWRMGMAGEQVKVDYASYVLVDFGDGEPRKLAARMLINQNPDAVENPANEVKPMRDAEMPPPDVFIEDWKKFGKALAEFGVEPGKDARGNDGFQADAGNAQQMVISKDADGNYAVYLKEENIWLNRQVEPLFVTKNLPEAANYFIAEVHNRRYKTDFPPNPVWMGAKAPTAVPNPETNVVDVPEAGAVSNAGLPNVVNIDTNGKFEDLQKQIQDAIDNGQQIAFNYKGEDRLVTPKRIWTNPKNGNINLDAVGEDGFKVYTIVNMENANNPVEATPIPEPTPIPEDVALPAENKPSTPLEDQMVNARAEFMRIGELLADKAVEGIGPSDPEFKKLEDQRTALINQMRGINDQIKQRDAVPSRDPQEHMAALKDEYKALGNEVLDLEISTNPDQNAIDEKRNRMNEIAQEMKDVKVQIDKQKSAPAPVEPNAPATEAPATPEAPKEDKFKDFKDYVDGLVNEPEFQKEYDFNNLGGDGILRVQDKNNKNQANIEWDENAQGYQVEFRPLDLGKKEVFADIQEAGQYAMDVLDKKRDNPRPAEQMVKASEKELLEGAPNTPEAGVDNPVVEGDAFDKLDDGNAIADLLGELAAKLPKFRNNRGERNARWARRYIDEAILGFRTRPIDRAGISELSQALAYANSIPDAGLRDSVVSEIQRLQKNLADKREVIKQQRIVDLKNKYENSLPNDLLPNNAADLNKENAIEIAKQFLEILPEKDNYDIDKYGDRAAQSLRYFIENMEGKPSDTPFHKTFAYDYLKNALGHLKYADFHENQKVLAVELEKFQNLFGQKQDLDKVKANKEMYDNLALPIDDANWPTQESIDKDKAIIALDEIIKRLPAYNDYQVDDDLRIAAARIRSFKQELADNNKELDQADIDYIESAVRHLRKGSNPAQNAFADKIENLASIITAKKEEIRNKRLEEYKRNLAAPFADGVIPENGEGINKNQLVALFEDLVNRLPKSDSRDFNYEMRRAGEYARNGLVDAQRIEDGNPDPFIRNFDDKYLERIISKLAKHGDKDEQALIPQLEKAKSALIEKKNALNADVREKYLARRDNPLPEGIVPDEQKESKQDFLDAVNEVLNRLPVDNAEEADTSIVIARAQLKQYINELESNNDPFAANTKHLKVVADALSKNGDAKYLEFADLLREVADYAVSRRLELPIPALAPGGMDPIDPIELAKERIQAGENPYTSPDLFKELFAGEDVFNNNFYLKPFQEQIQKFFDGQKHPLSDLDIRARQAMSQWVASQLSNPPRVMDEAAVENVHNLVSLMTKLDNEKMAFEPNREGLGDAGNRLLEIVPDEFFAAAKKAGSDKEIVINGVPTGFKAKQAGEGVNKGSNYIVTDIATGQRFIFKKEGKASQAKAEQEVALLASGLGINGRVYTELHPLDKKALIQTFAGDTNRKIGGAVLVENVMGNSDYKPAKQFHLRNALLMNILDALINNTDRHRQNFMVADADALGVEDNGYHNLYIFPIDHGYAAAINDGATGGVQNAKKFLTEGSGSTGGKYAKEIAQNIGATAYKDILDMSLQQLEQYLNRLGGGEISQQTLATIMSRMAELKGITLAELENWIGRK